MKTLSDFKQAIQKGVKLHTIFHQSPFGRDENNKLILKDEDKGIRTVNIVQSNAFTLLTPKKDDPTVLIDSWLYFPTANKVKFEQDSKGQWKVLILDEDFRISNPERKTAPLIPLVTYTFVKE